MKSIKNQYIALKEGKMTEAQFMRNVRMTLPEYISNVTLFKQAEKILMNKRIISEIKIEEIGMFNDPIGYKKSEPNPKDEIFKKELQDDGTYTIYKNGEAVKTGIDGEGNANAYINDEKRKVNESGGHANFGSMAFSGEKQEVKPQVTLDSLNVGDYVYIPMFSHDVVIIKDKKEDGTVGVGSPANSNIRYIDGNRKAELTKKAVVKVNETHSSNPNDRYEVKFSKENNTYQVWEGDTLVTDFATKEKADAEAKRLNIKQDIKQSDKKQVNESSINPKYNYFAVLKSNGKILNGWEYEDDLDKESILYYAYADMTDMDYKRSEYNIASLKYFKNRNIDPFDPNNWEHENNGSLNEAKDASATGYYNQDGKEQYSKFDELDNMNAQEIMAGYVMEKQDNPNIDQKEAVKLVIKNLKNDQFYYTNYKLTGVRGLKPTELTTTKRKPFFDQMEELDKNGSNLVDEKNKMVIMKEGLEIQEAEKQTVKIGNTAFGGKTADVKVDDKAIYNGKVVKITGITKKAGDDSQKYTMITSIDEKDKISYSGKPGNYKPFSTTNEVESDYNDEDFKSDTGISESQKTKLKEMVRKMMKEMFDGRDNVTDVTGENI